MDLNKIIFSFVDTMLISSSALLTIDKSISPKAFTGVGTERKIKGQDSETVRLVKFGITENSIGFYLLLTAGESQLFIESLRFGLSKIFNIKHNA